MTSRHWPRWIALAVCCLALPAQASAQVSQACVVAPEFEELYQAAPEEIGPCRSPETSQPGGDVLQVTSKGLLVRRNDGDWTGFVGARQTLLLNEGELVARPNTDRFDWELGGWSAEGAMFGEPSSGLLPETLLGFDYEVAEARTSEVLASVTITRATDRGRFRGPSTVIETVQLLPSEEMAHNLFLDMSGMRHGDLVLKTTQLGDESQVVAWKPDDTSGFRATFRQLAISARRSNAIVTVVLVPGTRLDYGVRLASMMFGCLR